MEMKPRKSRKGGTSPVDKCAGKKCPNGKICNPASGRCVKKTGRIGKALLKKSKSKIKSVRKSKSRRKKSVRKSKSRRKKTVKKSRSRRKKSTKKSKSRRSKSVRKSKSRRSKSVRKSKSMKKSKSIKRSKKSLKLINKIRNMNCVRDMDLAKLGDKLQKIVKEIEKRERDRKEAIEKSKTGRDQLERDYMAGLATDIKKDIVKLEQKRFLLKEELDDIEIIDNILKKDNLSVPEVRKLKYMIPKLKAPFRESRMKKLKAKR